MQVDLPPPFAIMEVATSLSSGTIHSVYRGESWKQLPLIRDSRRSLPLKVVVKTGALTLIESLFGFPLSENLKFEFGFSLQSIRNNTGILRYPKHPLFVEWKHPEDRVWLVTLSKWGTVEVMTDSAWERCTPENFKRIETPLYSKSSPFLVHSVQSPSFLLKCLDWNLYFYDVSWLGQFFTTQAKTTLYR